MFCGEFAIDYKREHPDAILKIGRHEGNDDTHCFVFDPTMGSNGVTIDATQGQFEIHNPAAYVDDFYLGDTHPHMHDVQSFETVDAFEEAQRNV